MLKYDRTALTKRAHELSVVRDTFEKVLRLCEILHFLGSNELTNNKLALKGGTAINLLFFDLPRLSVDIDLDYCADSGKEEMLSERMLIQDKLLKYMTASGYTLSPKSKSYHSLQSNVFEYINAGRVKDNIKIEINYSLRSHVMPTKRITVPDAFVSGGFDVNALSPIEIYATKTVALLTRGAARDLYDMNYMSCHKDFFSGEDLALYRKCVVFYLAVATESPISKIDYMSLNKITEHKILTDLKPVIRNRDAFELDRAKENVVNFLNENIYLTDNDKLFMDAFKKGYYRPDIIFDGDMLERIKNHPMALWKTQKNRDNVNID